MKKPGTVTSSAGLVAVVLFSLIVSGGRSMAVAETVYDKSGLASCIPDDDDPCADIVSPSSSVTVNAQAAARRMTIEQSPSGASPSATGAEPQMFANPGLRLSKPAVTPRAVRYVNTKIIQRNTTSYSTYWRVGALRGSTVWMWPSASAYYTVRKYSSVTKLIRCIQGETLYFGATSTDGRLYWGYSADLNKVCMSGCTGYCSGGTITITMR